MKQKQDLQNNNNCVYQYSNCVYENCTNNNNSNLRHNKFWYYHAINVEKINTELSKLENNYLKSFFGISKIDQSLEILFSIIPNSNVFRLYDQKHYKISINNETIKINLNDITENDKKILCNISSILINKKKFFHQTKSFCIETFIKNANKKFLIIDAEDENAHQIFFENLSKLCNLLKK